MRESASLTTAYLLEQNRKFEGFIREKISTLESRVNVQRSRLSLKALEEEEPGQELGGFGDQDQSAARPEPEAPYLGTLDMVDFRDLAGEIDAEASPVAVASLDDWDAADAPPAGGPPRAAAETQREPAQPAAPADWMAALIGAPASQPSSRSQAAAPAPGTEPPAVEADEGEAVQVRAPSAKLPAVAGEDLAEAEAQAPLAEPPAGEEDLLKAEANPSIAETAGAGEALPEAGTGQVIKTQMSPVRLAAVPSDVAPEAEREHAPLDDEAVAPFVSPWVWSTVEEGAGARPAAGLNAVPGPSPMPGSGLNGWISTPLQPSHAAGRAASSAPPPGDLEDGEATWESELAAGPLRDWA
jgi:hypothetical protein